MNPVLNYRSVVREIDQNFDLLSLSARDQYLREKIIRDHIHSLSDEEDVAIATIYLLLFGLKAKRWHDPDKIEDMYQQIKRDLLYEEQQYQKKIKKTKVAGEKKIVMNQLLYYYKLVGYYMTYLEKTLSHFGHEELSGTVELDKLHFLQNAQLLEGHVRKFLSYGRLAFSMFLRKYVFLYALLSGIGVVLFWHGLWGIYDWVIAAMHLSDNLTPYITTTVLGLGILYFLGVFFDQIVGDHSELQHMHEMELEEMVELRNLEKVVKRKMKQVLSQRKPEEKTKTSGE